MIDETADEAAERMERKMAGPKWTAGPWEIDDDEQRIDGIGTVKMYRVISPVSEVVAEFSNAGCNEIAYEDDGEGGGSHYDYQAMANARLIAAAPELYEALDRLLGSAEGLDEHPGSTLHAVRYAEAVDAARATLKKARGE